MADRRDLQQMAIDQLAEEVSNNTSLSGFVSVSDAESEIDDLEDNFDGDSVCPYYSQQSQIIDDYEREFGNSAEDFTGGKTYTASEWQQAQTAYAYAVAFAAFSHYFSEAKQGLIDGLQEFETDAARELDYDGEILVQLSMSCTHGWAAHDRELSDGTMIFESRQLDGCNGMARKIGETWVSCCFDPTPAKEEEEEATA